jgi:hypothetical protein
MAHNENPSTKGNAMCKHRKQNHTNPIVDAIATAITLPFVALLSLFD